MGSIIRNRPGISVFLPRCRTSSGPALRRRRISSVPWTQSDTLQVGDFRRLAFDVEQPLRIRGHGLRAMNRWFQAPEPAPAASAGLNSYLDGFSTVELPYEYVYDGASDDSLASFEAWLLASEDGLRQGLAPFVSECLHAERPQTGPRLLRFMAPLALLMAASRFNEASSHPLTQLYVAQAALSDLPHALQADVRRRSWSDGRAGAMSTAPASGWASSLPTRRGIEIRIQTCSTSFAVQKRYGLRSRDPEKIFFGRCKLGSAHLGRRGSGGRR